MLKGAGTAGANGTVAKAERSCYTGRGGDWGEIEMGKEQGLDLEGPREPL